MNKIFFLIYFCILFASFVASILNRKNLPGAFKLFSLYIGATLIIEAIGYYLLFIVRQSTASLYLYSMPFVYSILAFIYFKAIKTYWKKVVVKFSIPGFLALALILLLFVQQPEDQETYAIMAMSFLIVILSLFYYYELLKEEAAESMFEKPLFWVSTGNLIFYAGVFFLHGFIQRIAKQDVNLALKLMFINYGLNYILYSLYTLGFLCKSRYRIF